MMPFKVTSFTLISSSVNDQVFIKTSISCVLFKAEKQKTLIFLRYGPTVEVALKFFHFHKALELGGT